MDAGQVHRGTSTKTKKTKHYAALRKIGRMIGRKRTVYIYQIIRHARVHTNVLRDTVKMKGRQRHSANLRKNQEVLFIGMTDGIVRQVPRRGGTNKIHRTTKDNVAQQLKNLTLLRKGGAVSSYWNHRAHSVSNAPLVYAVKGIRRMGFVWKVNRKVGVLFIGMTEVIASQVPRRGGTNKIHRTTKDNAAQHIKNLTLFRKGGAVSSYWNHRAHSMSNAPLVYAVQGIRPTEYA